MTASGVPPARQFTGFVVVPRTSASTMHDRQGRKHALRVVHLDLPAAQRNRQVAGQFVEGRLIFARADDEELGSGARVQSIRAGHGDPQCREIRSGG